MARAHSIWCIEQEDEGFVRFFTVKHECCEWMMRFVEENVRSTYTIHRYPDNQRDNKLPDVTSKNAEDFLTKEGYVSNDRTNV